MADGAVDFNHTDLAVPSHDGVPGSPGPRVRLQSKPATVREHRTRVHGLERHDLPTLPRFRFRGLCHLTFDTTHTHTHTDLRGRTDGFTLKGGDATTGTLTTTYDGPRPDPKIAGTCGKTGTYQPMRKQGAIILATGGDNSNSAMGKFYEVCQLRHHILLVLIPSLFFFQVGKKPKI